MRRFGTGLHQMVEKALEADMSRKGGRVFLVKYQIKDKERTMKVWAHAPEECKAIIEDIKKASVVIVTVEEQG